MDNELVDAKDIGRFGMPCNEGLHRFWPKSTREEVFDFRIPDVMVRPWKAGNYLRNR